MVEGVRKWDNHGLGIIMMRILIGLFVLAPFLAFGQAVSRTELRATNTALVARINATNTALVTGIANKSNFVVSAHGKVLVTNNASVGGTMDVTGDFSVGGISVFTGNGTFNDILNANGVFNSSGGAAISGTLNVSSTDPTFVNNTIFNSTISVAGQASAASFLATGSSDNGFIALSNITAGKYWVITSSNVTQNVTNIFATPWPAGLGWCYQVESTNGFRVLWTNGPCGGGGSAITGADTRVLFFDGANSPAGDAGMTYDKTTDSLTVAGAVATSALTASTLQTTEGVTVGGDLMAIDGNNRVNTIAQTNTGPVVFVAGNTSTNVDFGARDIHTNFVPVGVTSVAFILSNVHANASKILAIVNRTNDATIGWAGAINWYGDALTTAPSNSTVFIGFNTIDGKTNAWVIAGQRVSQSTNDFALNAYNTNVSAKAAFVAAAITMTNDAATDRSEAALYLDQDGDGTWEKTGIACRLQGVIAVAGSSELSAFVMPGGRFMFTNLSVGGGAAVTIKANSSQLVRP